MKQCIVAAGIAAVMASGAHAQSTTSQSQSSSASQSGIYMEGSDIPENTPGLGGLVGSAGNCYPGAGFQAVGPGAGISIGGGRVDPECNTRMEMAALAAVAGNSAAIAHACKHDESMRETLVELGRCRIQSNTTMSTSERPSEAQQVPAGLIECSRSVIRLSDRVSTQQQNAAVAWCKARLDG